MISTWGVKWGENPPFKETPIWRCLEKVTKIFSQVLVWWWLSLDTWNPFSDTLAPRIVVSFFSNSKKPQTPLVQVDLSVPDEAQTCFFFSPDETLEKNPDDRPTHRKHSSRSRAAKRWSIIYNRWYSFKVFFIFTPNLWGNDQIVELIFFGWVGSTTN